MDNTFDTPAILSLCSGGLLGLERGIESVLGKLRVAAYVEIEAFLCWNLVKQMEQSILDSAPVWTNVKTFPAHFFHNRIHIITAGYPCQPFSVAGLSPSGICSSSMESSKSVAESVSAEKEEQL